MFDLYPQSTILLGHAKAFQLNRILISYGKAEHQVLYVSFILGSIEVDEDTMELVLPSGARAGHRSLKHFYKQSMPPAHLQFKRERKILKNLTAEYKALGWHGTVAVTTRKQMADHKIKAHHAAGERLKLGLKANSFQPHFRSQVPI